MIKKVIFLMETRFNLRDYQRFGIEILQQSGFKVEIWDLTPIQHPELFKVYTPVDVFDYGGLTLFHDKSEAIDKLSSLSSNDFIINFIPYIFSGIWAYRAISRSKADYALYYANAIPGPIIKNGVLKLLSHNFKTLINFRHQATWKNLFMKLPIKYFWIRPAKILFLGGSRSSDYFSPPSKGAGLVYAHSLDYDLYLKERNKLSATRSIVVFLDEFLPFHFEYRMMKENNLFKEDAYYGMLNNFFDKVEKVTGLEVVIAAHPRSDYENRPDYFKGRRRIKGNTVNLVRECQLVINQCSTAVNFAALFYKPVIFISFSSLDNTYEDYWIRGMAKWFGKEPIYIDRVVDIDFKKEAQVNRCHYDNYIRAYIKTDHSENLPFWQIIANRLKDE